MEPCKCLVILVDRVPFTYVYLSMTYCTEIDAAGFNVPIESRALKWRCRTEDKVLWTCTRKPRLSWMREGPGEGRATTKRPYHVVQPATPGGHF